MCVWLVDFLPTLYGRHEPGPGLARADEDALAAAAYAAVNR